MQLTRTFRVEAPPERVWAVMQDVAGWPRWTASVSAVEALDPGDFRVGARFRLDQPKLPRAVWTVTALEPGRSFEWRSASPGLQVIGRHAVAPDGAGSTVTLDLEQRGFLAPVLGWLTRSLTERYVGFEADGLKAFCEAP